MQFENAGDETCFGWDTFRILVIDPQKISNRRVTHCAEKVCSRNGGLLAPRIWVSSFPIEKMNGSYCPTHSRWCKTLLIFDKRVAQRTKCICALRSLCLWSEWRGWGFLSPNFFPGKCSLLLEAYELVKGFITSMGNEETQVLGESSLPILLQALSAQWATLLFEVCCQKITRTEKAFYPKWFN